MPPSADPTRIPAARQAFLTRAVVLAAAGVTLVVFLAVDSHSHSVSDTFYGMVVPEATVLVVAAAALLLLKASRRVAR